MLSAINHRVTGSTASRFGLLAVVVLISAGVAFGAVELTRPHAQRHTETSGLGSNGPSAPTVARPLATPPATQVSMAQATATCGSPVVLPTTSAAQSSDAGPVWEVSDPGEATVAVTFPSKGVFIDYTRPATYSDPASGYKGLSADLSGSQLVQLSETTPALYIPANDGSGTNALDFETNGAEIRVCGNDDQATLTSIAQSILTQLSPSSSSGT